MNKTLEIKKGVERPADLPTRSAPVKYPVDKMEVDDYFEVPWEWYFGDEAEPDKERYDAKRHRNRVHSAVRGWALKQNKAAAEEPNFNPAEFKPLKFTVASLESGNIGVWRDQ